MSKSIQPASMGQLGKAFLTWRRYLQKQVQVHQITLKQLSVLRKLSHVDYLHPSEVAEMLFCDRPTATVIINNMRKYGWVETRKDPGNRKFQQIVLTERGLDKLNEINQAEHLQSDKLFDPLACFSDEEQVEFERLIMKLNQHLLSIDKEDEDE
jgi:DNA-binding MarR family transcriptional regulator